MGDEGQTARKVISLRHANTSSLLILKITLRGTCYYCSHFTDMEVEVQVHPPTNKKRTGLQLYQFVLMHSAWVSRSQDLWLQSNKSFCKQERMYGGTVVRCQKKGKVRHVIGKNRKQGNFKGQVGGMNSHFIRMNKLRFLNLFVSPLRTQVQKALGPVPPVGWERAGAEDRPTKPISIQWDRERSPKKTWDAVSRRKGNECQAGQNANSPDCTTP